MVWLDKVIDIVDHLTESWLLKVGLSAVAEIGIWMLGLKHVQVAGIFVALIFIDLITKCLAISHKMLIDMGAKTENLNIIDRWIAIPMAWNKKLIDSEIMKNSFIDKIWNYAGLTIVCYFIDLFIMKSVGNGSFALNLAWLYLASSEFFSILENMRDAGNVTIGKFLDLVKNKIERKISL